MQGQEPAAIMRMQVSEQGDEVCIELSGVAGRHQRILQALTQSPFGLGPSAASAGSEDGADAGGRGLPLLLPAANVNIRAGADDMHIRLKGRGRGAPALEALSLYHYLRHVLIERGGEGAGAGTIAAAPALTPTLSR